MFEKTHPYAAATRFLGAWLDAYLDATQEANERFGRAAARSGEDARGVLGTVVPEGGFPDPWALTRMGARLGDLARAQAFLWTETGLEAGERMGRIAARGFFDVLGVPAPFALPHRLSARTLVFGTVAADLYSGYAALRERERWLPGLVGEEDRELQHRRGAGRILDAAEALGGALIKAGQFASTRPDLLPAAYTDTLSALQDRLPPRPWETIENAISDELGRSVGEVFSGIEPEPVAAASIAQVHRARLRDGRTVAVKVQYPDVAELIEADLDALEAVFDAISRLEPEIRLQPIADYLRWTLPLELDFRREAKAMGELGEALAHREDVIVPEVVEELNTERLLVMEFVPGVKITDREAMQKEGIEPREVAELLNDVYAEQLFERRVLHADPHPGNLFVKPGPQGPALVLLDHGLTLSLEPSFVGSLAKMVRALSGGDFDALGAALEEAGLPSGEDADLPTLLKVVGVLMGGESEGASVGFEGFGRSLGASVGEIPPRLLLVGRAIGLLDGITRRLDPDLDAMEVVARHAG